MIISSPADYRNAAKRKLPRFFFDYIDGGAYAEHTLKANITELEKVTLRQRILKNVENLSLETCLFDQKLAMPVVLSLVGITGMYARRGEVQAAKAAEKKGIPFTLSTVSICSLEEVASQSAQPIWFQLYVLKDRGFMKNVLERAQAVGVQNLVFTADMPGLTPLRTSNKVS
ncbi:alpha-hydroxy-acid oxidizing protein [Legionella maioricensis]|uniref:alpha-hydroxy-acid oxidizing protein n=1 Tax=Legionella maioricensis TaxID=2896528 RepID=UPI00253F90F3|nr:alpha-hydroxy-acid oxidizing protein [Legionella maioricensis]